MRILTLSLELPPLYELITEALHKASLCKERMSVIGMSRFCRFSKDKITISGSTSDQGVHRQQIIIANRADNRITE